jgi:hypothetical protein
VPGDGSIAGDLNGSRRRLPLRWAGLALGNCGQGPANGHVPAEGRAGRPYRGGSGPFILDPVGTRRSPRRRSDRTLLSPASLAFPPDGPPESVLSNPTRSRSDGSRIPQGAS